MCDRLSELLIANLVCRPGITGQEATADLVLTLGTGFKQRQFVFDAIFNTLVVTGLKMQAVEFFQTSPVPAKKGIVATQHNCPGNITLLVAGENQY